MKEIEYTTKTRSNTRSENASKGAKSQDRRDVQIV